MMIQDQVEQEKLLKTMFKHNCSGICFYDSKGYLKLINDKAVSYLSDKKEDLIGKHFSNIFSEEIINMMMKRFDQVRELDTAKSYSDLLEIKGSRRWYRTTYTPLYAGKNTNSNHVTEFELNNNTHNDMGLKDKRTSLLGYEVVSRDITKEKKKEDALIHAQKMEVMGKLVAGIAHEFNNVLVSVLGNAEVLRLQYEREHPDVGHAAEIIIKSSKRAKTLTNQLLTFTKRDTFNPISIDVEDSLAKIGSKTQKSNSSKIKYKLHCEKKIPQIEADYTQFEQAITNILLNSVEAMKTGGTIDISVETLKITDENDIIEYELDLGHYLQINIRDEGGGIPSEVVENLFDPFNTTKTNRNGLGLPVSHAILLSHGGNLKIQPKIPIGLHFGAEVSLIFPVSENKNNLEIDEISQVSLEGIKVLVVDDEYYVLKTLSKVLMNMGIYVKSFDSGKFAVEYLIEQKDKVDIVLLDMNMPDMHGEEVYEKIKNIDSDIKVIFISGYSKSEMLERINSTETIHFIQKPFTLEEIRSKISLVLRN